MNKVIQNFGLAYVDLVLLHSNAIPNSQVSVEDKFVLELKYDFFFSVKIDVQPIFLGSFFFEVGYT